MKIIKKGSAAAASLLECRQRLGRLGVFARGEIAAGPREI